MSDQDDTHNTMICPECGQDMMIRPGAVYHCDSECCPLWRLSITPSSDLQPSQVGEAPSPDTPNGDGVSSTSPDGSFMAPSGEAPPAQLGNSKPGGAIPVPTSPGISPGPSGSHPGGGPPLDATHPRGGQPIRPHGNPWTAEDDALLRRRWNEKGGAAAIGRELSRTRNAVIGRASRLGLSVSRVVVRVRQRRAGEEAAARRAVAVAKRAQVALARPPVVPVPEPQVVIVPKDGSAPTQDACELVDFTNHTCRFPLGELADPVKWFCGVPEADLTAGVAYCRFHMEICYSAPRWR